MELGVLVLVLDLLLVLLPVSLPELQPVLHLDLEPNKDLYLEAVEAVSET